MLTVELMQVFTLQLVATDPLGLGSVWHKHCDKPRRLITFQGDAL